MDSSNEARLQEINNIEEGEREGKLGFGSYGVSNSYESI